MEHIIYVYAWLASQMYVELDFFFIFLPFLLFLTLGVLKVDPKWQYTCVMLTINNIQLKQQLDFV